jgi:hypothetical protein
MLLSCDSGGGTGSATLGTYTLTSGGALCGKDRLSTAYAYKALENNDKAGALGLVSRGEVELLESGTTVHAFYQDGELSDVTVTSGSSLGKDCWMPTKMLGTRTEGR